MIKMSNAAVTVAKVRRASPERQVQVKLRRWLQTVLPVGTIVAAIKNEHAPRSKTREGRIAFFAKRKAEGVVTGFPDLLALMPAGQAVLIEVKAPKTGTVSQAQSNLHGVLRSLGYPVIVANSVESARGALLEQGIKLREAAGEPVELARVRVAKSRGRTMRQAALS